jgi:hypothetical protein
MGGLRGQDIAPRPAIAAGTVSARSRSGTEAEEAVDEPCVNVATEVRLIGRSLAHFPGSPPLVLSPSR